MTETLVLPFWLEVVTAQQELGQGKRADEAEQRNQQGTFEVGVTGITDTQHQHGQHGQDVQVVQRQHPVLGGRATEQPDQRQAHGQGEDEQAGKDSIGEQACHWNISISGRS